MTEAADRGPVVAHCATPYLWDGGGSWIHNQIAWLQRWHPVVLTQEARNLDQYPVADLFSAEDFSPSKRFINRLVRHWTGEYPFYDAFLRRTGARVVHAHFGYQACRCLRAIRATGLPLLTTFYGADATSYTRQPQWRRRYVKLFESGRLFLAEGSTMARHVAEAGAPPERIRVHHLGVDTRRIPFRERGAEDGVVRILMCGHFREKKGFPDGLRALGRALQGVQGVDVQVVMIGDGPERDRVLEAITDSGLGDRVELRGLLPYREVLQSLESCHLLLQPSRTATDGDSEGGAPVILLDAQAAGVPVVATTHADIPEYVIDGGSGMLAPEGDLDGLTDLLRQMLTSPQRWAEMGRRGRAHVEAEYDARRQVERLELIYDDLVAAAD
ncbi:MAG: glycosyltransferase [Candidatus Latescibacterota bacterium]|nr:glycosyltransferase [Candidatus Latescibacterota bacterium]